MIIVGIVTHNCKKAKFTLSSSFSFSLFYNIIGGDL